LKALNSTILISDINVHVVRKNVKNINFSVRASDGRVRVSAPTNISKLDLHAAITSKINWIRNKIQSTENRSQLKIKSYHSGETIKYLDREYTLKVMEHKSTPKVIQCDGGIIEIYVRPNTLEIAKEKLIYEWYRSELKRIVPILIDKWQPIMDVKVSHWGIKRMKTRWGTCNISNKNIWLNLELARYSEACLEYVIVHEMTHLLERNHNARFKQLLDGYLPNWRNRELELNAKT